MLYGWDISTSVIGVARFSDDGVFSDVRYFDLRKVDTGLIEKSAAAEVKMLSAYASVLEKEKSSVHFIEDRLGGFGGGKTMQQTLLKLAAFNATVSYMIWKMFGMDGREVSVEHIHPSRVKSVMRRHGLVIPKGADKKKMTLEWVSRREPSFPVEVNKNGNYQPYCYDEADAYAICLAGYTLRCEKKER